MLGCKCVCMSLHMFIWQSGHCIGITGHCIEHVGLRHLGGVPLMDFPLQVGFQITLFSLDTSYSAIDIIVVALFE